VTVARHFEARIDFTFGGVTFKAGDRVPTSIGLAVESLRPDFVTVVPSSPGPEVAR
jgi:hypothetical protein